MQTIAAILEEIKKRNLNVSEIARTTAIPEQRIYKWLKGPYKPKADDADKLKSWARKNLEEIPLAVVAEEEVLYGTSNLDIRLLFNLSESNKILAESNKTLAQANKQLADNTSVLTSKYVATAGGDQRTSTDVQATLQALQEYLSELASKVKGKTVAETAAELGTRMVAKKKALDKKDTPADGGK